MKLALITIPYDSGHYNMRMGLGPDKLLAHVKKRCADLRCAVRHEEILSNAEFQTEISTSFELSRTAALSVKSARANGEFPIIISGNCNTAAMAAISGIGESPGVIWLDCHGDFNTPDTTIGGFMDGTALSMITGACWQQLILGVPGYEPIREDKIILAGVRDLDPLEDARLNRSKISIIHAAEMNKTSNAQWRKIDGPIYLHIDLDVIDPDVARANTYSTAGGITPAGLVKAIQDITNRYELAALSFTAYDPAVDPEDKVPTIVNSLVDMLLETFRHKRADSELGAPSD